MSKVVLKPTLADSMRSIDHVVVTTNDIGGENVTWLKVDKETLTDSANRVPSSKIVSDISVEVDALGNDYDVLSVKIGKLETSADTISSDLSEITDNATGKLGKLSADIEYLSAGLSALYNHKAVRFIGVSETDPATGIVTLNGVKYVISTDFDASNNGDIIYYRTAVANHKTTHIPEDDTAINYKPQDQHEDVEYIRMLYAYIYSNGVLDNYGSAVLTSDEEEEDPAGTFQKFGYGFYENLSTLIHDWDVCDDAGIQKHKISGLVDDLDELYRRDNYISGVLGSVSTGLSNKITTNITDIANIKSNYATKIYVNDKIDGLSACIDDKFATKVELNQAVTNLENADSRLLQTMSTTSAVLTSTIQVEDNKIYTKLNNNYIANNRVLTGDNNAYASLTATNTHPIDATYAKTLLNKRFLSANIMTTMTNVTSTTHVPSMKLLTDLSNSIVALINGIRPALGTLRFVGLSSTSGSSNQSIVNAAAFDGWVYPDGSTLTCNANDFKTVKPYFGASANATSFTLPKLDSFLEMWPQRANSSVNPNTKQPYQQSMPNHTHTLANVSASATASGTTTIPTGKSATDGGKAHHGGGKASGSINNVPVNVVLNSIQITGSTGNPNESSYASKEPKPYHRRIPVMMYIGFKQ